MSNELKFCPDHKCMKDKIDKIGNDKRFWHRIFDSKWFFWAATGIIVVWMGFNVWVTNKIQEQKSAVATEKEITKIISYDVKEIKEDNKKRDEMRREDQKEIMKILFEIQKQIKK